MEWKYVKKLNDEKNIEEFEKLVRIKLPEDYKNFIKKYNGGRPSKKAFKTISGTEHLVKTFLSYNKEDLENIFKTYEYGHDFFDEVYFAIGNDPFGNYILSDKKGRIYYFDLESGKTEFIGNSFEQFIESLYD